MKTLLINLALILLLPLSLFGQSKTYPQVENTHRIMSYNICNAKGMDNVRDVKRISEVIRSVNPEVVALQELDSVTTRSGGTDVAKEIADLTRMYHVYGPAISFQGGKYGIAILSREKPLSSKLYPLPGREEARALLLVEFADYAFLCTHLSLTEEDATESLRMADRIASEYPKPVIIAGDFNLTPQTAGIQEMQKRWKPLSNLKHATYPSDGPKNTIDYIMGFTGNGQRFTVLGNRVLNEPVASDHAPLFADIRIPVPANQVMRTIPYLQQPGADEMTVMWMTHVPCRSWVEYGTDTTNLTRARSFIEGEMVANNKLNRIRLEGLHPGTRYYYRVVSQEITLYRAYHKEFGDTIYSPFHSFRTLDEKAENFTVAIFNDLHKNYRLFDKLSAQIKDANCDLVIFNGDCIDDAENEEAIVGTIDYYGRKYGSESIPSIYLRGNHETRGEYSVLLWDYLGRTGGDRTYGSFTLGDTRFVLMDAGEDKPDTHPVYYDMNDFTGYRMEQAAFLTREIASKPFKKASKRVLIHHIPIYGQTDSYNPCLEIWGPVMDKARFDICLNAHTHRYNHLSKGEAGNPFPVVVGGGNGEETATFALLQKRGKALTLTVYDTAGNVKITLNL